MQQTSHRFIVIQNEHLFFCYLELKPHPHRKPTAPPEMDLAHTKEVNRDQHNRGWINSHISTPPSNKQTPRYQWKEKHLDLIARRSE
jgi:hypothetical protein